MARLGTFFSGTTGPTGDRPGPDGIIARTLMYLAGAVVFPVGLVVYATWMLLFTYARLPWWISGVSSLGLLLVGAATGNIGLDAALFYLSGYFAWVTETFAPNGDVFVAFANNFGQIVVGQLWLGFLIATLWAGVSSGWKWVRRPSWQERSLNPGPVLKGRVKKTEAAIAQGVASPVGGITIGVSHDKRDPRFSGGKPGERFGGRVVLSDAESSGHVFIVGGSGSGKTSTMLVGIRDVIRQGRGVIFIDCKGGPDVPEQISEWAERYGRDFLHWTIQDPSTSYHGPADSPAYYDPVSRGDASRRKDLLIGSQRWDVEYYKEVIANYLQTVFTVIDLVPPLPGVDTFTDVADLLEPSALSHRARFIDALKHPDLASALQRILDMDSTERSGIRGMYSRLHTLTSSSAGKWLRRDPEGLRDIDLRKVADEGQVVVFSLDTSNYEDTATLLAGLIVQDLKTLSSELRNDPAEAPVHVYVDEFSAVDTNNILGLLAKARDAKMPCTLATQALADLARREPTFVDQVLGIVSSFIIHRANAEADARIYAGISGVTRKMVERMSFEQSSGTLGTMGAASSTGVGYAEERDEYAIHVGAFQDLRRGQAIFIAKSPVARYVNPVHITMEDPMVRDGERDPGLNVHREKRFRAEPKTKLTYPHPANVAMGIEAAPGSETLHPDGNALDILLDRPAEAAPAAAGRPRRPGGTPVTPGVTAGSPLPLQGSQPAGRPAGAPMPLVRPVQRPRIQNPEEWNGIP